MMNDLAESQLLKAIKDGNMTAISFWLRSRHSAYGNKMEIVDTTDREELTKEQKELVENNVFNPEEKELKENSQPSYDPQQDMDQALVFYSLVVFNAYYTNMQLR